MNLSVKVEIEVEVKVKVNLPPSTICVESIGRLSGDQMILSVVSTTSPSSPMM